MIILEDRTDDISCTFSERRTDGVSYAVRTQETHTHIQVTFPTCVLQLANMHHICNVYVHKVHTKSRVAKCSNMYK